MMVGDEGEEKQVVEKMFEEFEVVLVSCFSKRV